MPPSDASAAQRRDSPDDRAAPGQHQYIRPAAAGAALVPLLGLGGTLTAGARLLGADIPDAVLWAQLGGLLGLIGLGVGVARAGIFARPVLRGPADVPCVALTFDDGPDPRGTPAVLQQLAQHGAQATFFAIGRKAQRYPDLMADIAAGGHQIENHSFAHDRLFALRSVAVLHRDLLQAQAALGAAGAVGPRFLRPPVGLISPPVAAAARRAGLDLCHWSCAARDGTARATVAGATRRLLAGLVPGAILVLHDGAEREDRTPIAAAVLAQVLPELAARGLRPVRLDQLLPPDLDRGRDRG